MIRSLLELIDVANNIGTISNINMYDEKTLYLKGKTEEGENFNLSLIIKKEEQENA